MAGSIDGAGPVVPDGAGVVWAPEACGVGVDVLVDGGASGVAVLGARVAWLAAGVGGGVGVGPMLGGGVTVVQPAATSARTRPTAGSRCPSVTWIGVMREL